MIGHNPKAKANHQSDDMHEISALLRELPRVAAPTDFNASLKARLAVAKADAHEFAGITALVKELPRVAAPADFDFKLRARIAQAKAEQQKSSRGWFAELFGRSFSWVQAGAAMAAVAIVVSLVTVGVLRNEKEPTPANSTNIAANVAAAAPIVTPPPSLDSSEPRTIAPSMPETRTNVPVKASTIKYQAPTTSANQRTTGLRNSSGERLVTPPNVEPTAIASKVMIKHRSGEARMINPSEYNLGLQTAHLRPTPAKATATEAAMNIY